MGAHIQALPQPSLQPSLLLTTTTTCRRMRMAPRLIHTTMTLASPAPYHPQPPLRALRSRTRSAHPRPLLRPPHPLQPTRICHPTPRAPVLIPILIPTTRSP